jgi:hypothetical protein
MDGNKRKRIRGASVDSRNLGNPHSSRAPAQGEPCEGEGQSSFAFRTKDDGRGALEGAALSRRNAEVAAGRFGIGRDQGHCRHHLLVLHHAELRRCEASADLEAVAAATAAGRE